LCCEIFVTKSKLKASLAVWQNLLPYIFQGGLQAGSSSRRAAPGPTSMQHALPKLSVVQMAVFHLKNI